MKMRSTRPSSGAMERGVAVATDPSAPPRRFALRAAASAQRAFVRRRTRARRLRGGKPRPRPRKNRGHGACAAASPAHGLENRGHCACAAASPAHGPENHGYCACAAVGPAPCLYKRARRRRPRQSPGRAAGTVAPLRVRRTLSHGRCEPPAASASFCGPRSRSTDAMSRYGRYGGGGRRAGMEGGGWGGAAPRASWRRFRSGALRTRRGARAWAESAGLSSVRFGWVRSGRVGRARCAPPERRHAARHLGAL